MSVAGAKRRQITSGYAHLGKNLRRPTVAGKKNRSLAASITAEKIKAARMAAASKKKK